MGEVAEELPNLNTGKTQGNNPLLSLAASTPDQLQYDANQSLFLNKIKTLITPETTKSVRVI